MSKQLTIEEINRIAEENANVEKAPWVNSPNKDGWVVFEGRKDKRVEAIIEKDKRRLVLHELRQQAKNKDNTVKPNVRTANVNISLRLRVVNDVAVVPQVIYDAIADQENYSFGELSIKKLEQHYGITLVSEEELKPVKSYKAFDKNTSGDSN